MMVVNVSWAFELHADAIFYNPFSLATPTVEMSYSHIPSYCVG
jgi:hypothetical protein